MEKRQKTLVEQVAQIIMGEHDTGNRYCWAESAAVRIIELVRSVVKRELCDRG